VLPDLFSTQQSSRLTDQLQHELTKQKNPPLHCALLRINDFRLTLYGVVNDLLSKLFRLPDSVHRPRKFAGFSQGGLKVEAQQRI
jgi:hypothetical protein